MAKVYVNMKPNDDPIAVTERAIKKFNKEVEKEGIIKQAIDRKYFVSKTEKRKAMKKAARRKQLKQMYKERNSDMYY